MLRTFFALLTIFAVESYAASSGCAGTVVGDTVNASNTFQTPTIVGGAESIFAIGSNAVSDPGIEFEPFAGIYDVDFSDGALTMTLKSNTGLSFLNYGAGTFDRYYYGFDNHFVDSVAVTGGDNELTNGLTVGLLAPGFSLNAADNFGLGIDVPREYPTGGFFVQFGEGTDLNTLDTSVSIGFTSTAVPEPASGAILGGLSMLMVLRRRRD